MTYMEQVKDLFYAGLTVGIVAIFITYPWRPRWPFRISFGLLVIFLAVMFAVKSSVVAPGVSAPHDEKVIHTEKLAPLPGTGGTGSDFLSIATDGKGRTIYQYMQRNTDGSLTLRTIDSATRVKEDANATNARIDTTRCVYADPQTRENWGYCDSSESFILHVPHGAIVQKSTATASR